MSDQLDFAVVNRFPSFWMIPNNSFYEEVKEGETQKYGCYIWFTCISKQKQLQKMWFLSPTEHMPWTKAAAYAQVQSKLTPV